MDREIPKGKTDLYVLSAAFKWHPYAARTLPVTSPFSVCVRLCTCLYVWLVLLKKIKEIREEQ